MTSLNLLSHIVALFMTSLTQTAGHKWQHSWLFYHDFRTLNFNWTTNQTKNCRVYIFSSIAVCIFLVPCCVYIFSSILVKKAHDASSVLISFNTSVSRLGTSVSRLGTSVSRLGTSVSRLGTSVSRLDKSVW